MFNDHYCYNDLRDWGNYDVDNGIFFAELGECITNKGQSYMFVDRWNISGYNNYSNNSNSSNSTNSS